MSRFRILFYLFCFLFVVQPSLAGNDCNQNGVPDEEDIATGTSQDCTRNDVPDECDLADGTSDDCNLNGIPDECDVGPILDFVTSETSPELEYPFATVAVDVNLDGIADLATVNWVESTDEIALSVFFGDGLGKFTGPMTYIVGNGDAEGCITASDFNNDGYVDIAVGMGSTHAVGVFLNTSDGTFEPVTIVPNSFDVDVIDAGDYDGDQAIDMIVGAYDHDRMTFFENIGDGTFVFSKLINVPLYGVTGINSADLDGDADLDLVVNYPSYYEESVELFMNMGDGNFAEPTPIDVPEVTTAVSVVDINLDDMPDIVSGNSESPFQLTILTNTGDGSFAREDVEAPYEIWAIDFADFDSDGEPDIATVGDDEDKAVVFLTQDGEVDSIVEFLLASGSSTYEFQSLTAADFNNDGRVDLAVPDILAWHVWILMNDTVHGEYVTDCDENGIPDECDPSVTTLFPSKLSENTTGLPDDIFLGPPDNWGDGIGKGGVIYDLVDKFVFDGDGPDFNVYQRDSSSDPDDFADIDVLISVNGESFVSVKTTEGPGLSIPGDEAHDDPENVRSYDLYISGMEGAKYVSIQTLGAGLWEGFKLDAIGIAQATDFLDCNDNEIPDSCDIEDGTSPDKDADGVPDECEAIPPCDGDANGDNVVDPLDSGFVLSRFNCSVGTGNVDCDAADQNGDGVVDPLDVGYVLSRFGECE